MPDKPALESFGPELRREAEPTGSRHFLPTESLQLEILRGTVSTKSNRRKDDRACRRVKVAGGAADDEGGTPPRIHLHQPQAAKSQNAAAFEERVMLRDEVMECYLMTGDAESCSGTISANASAACFFNPTDVKT